MHYPKINLTIEKLRALADQALRNYYIKDLQFVIDSYSPKLGGHGHFIGQHDSHHFDTIKDLITIAVNRAQLPEEMFYYPDAPATCKKLEEELTNDGYKCSWSDSR